MAQPRRRDDTDRSGGRRGGWSMLRRSRNRRSRPLPPRAARPVAGEPAPADGIAGGGGGSSGGGIRAWTRRALRAGRALLPLLGTVTLFALVAVGGLRLVHFVRHSPHFALREVRVSGVRHLGADAVRARAGIDPGVNLFSFSLEDVHRRLRADPWIAAARVHRELPATLAIEVEEREAAVTVELGGLYLADARGQVFKRATLDEALGCPIVTGVARDAYRHDREGAALLLREAVSAITAWRADPARPALGEVHVDAAAGTTLYLKEGGLGVALGHAAGRALLERLARVDAVRAALEASGQRPALIHADAPSHPERISVRLASAPPARRTDPAAAERAGAAPIPARAAVIAAPPGKN